MRQGPIHTHGFPYDPFKPQAGRRKSKEGLPSEDQGIDSLHGDHHLTKTSNAQASGDGIV